MKSRDRVRAGWLFDMYGPLLTDVQAQVWQLYYLEDWSLAEIGEAREISRAAVHDVLDRTEKLLEDYETRLGLLTAHTIRAERLKKLLTEVQGLTTRFPELVTVQETLDQWAEEEGIRDV